MRVRLFARFCKFPYLRHRLSWARNPLAKVWGEVFPNIDVT